jgi:iron complex outermembrane receptor protein
MIYATMRGGYLAGGFNNQTYTPDHSGQTFKPEKVVDFETGVKSDWDLWGRPIRTNLAVFYSNYKNMQRVQNGQTTDPVSGAFVSYVAVQNAGAATAYGFDLDITYEPTDNLTLSAGWNHVESEYTKFSGSDQHSQRDSGCRPCR